MVTDLLVMKPCKYGPKKCKCQIFEVKNRTKNTIGITEKEFITPHTISLVLNKKIIPKGESAWLWVFTEEVSYESEY